MSFEALRVVLASRYFFPDAHKLIRWDNSVSDATRSSPFYTSSHHAPTFQDHAVSGRDPGNQAAADDFFTSALTLASSSYVRRYKNVYW